MFTAERKVGRLVEVRLGGVIRQDEFDEGMVNFRALVNNSNSRKVLCADLRPVRILVPEVAEALLEAMRRDNPVLDRSAILVSDSALFSLQMERLVREARNPNRRTFRDEAGLVDWVSEVLTQTERRRAIEFLRSISAELLYNE
jgi:hypothetical protein